MTANSTAVVRTQAELDKALAANTELIEIRSPAGVWLKVTAHDSSTVAAYDSSTVKAYDSSTVMAYDSSTVMAYGSSTVKAYGSSTVTATDSSTVTATDSPSVMAYYSSTVTATDSSTVRAYDSSTVTATDSSTVKATGSSTVRATGSSTVMAYGSSTVTATDSSTVTAYGFSTVMAYDSSTVTAYDSTSVTASPCVAVHLHSGLATIDGGVVIDVTTVNDTAEKWCAHHGVEVADGIATVYKAVSDQWTTSRGADYTPGSTPEATDWADHTECGQGLHFGPTPAHALAYLPDATRFVAVGVELATLRPIPGGTAKCKASKVVRACVEVDLDGNEVES